MKSFDEVWEQIHSTQEWGKYPSEIVIRFIARNYYKKDRANTRILDFGCGGGAHTWYLAREGFDVYAFDGSKSAVEKVKKRLEVESLHADLRVLDGAEIDYEENFFDAVVDNVTIYANELAYINEMYRKVYRSLKEGGKLLTVVFSTDMTGFGTGEELEYHTYRDITEGNLSGRAVAHFFDRDEIENLLLDVGFKNLKVDSMNYTDNGNKVKQWIICCEK
ncbi:class I SAM-dependent methyltransferase [Butyrivibrio sp. AE2032]|uniref:class I SAM-dependent methyltransferase n=1 Tax=Butyrivibrio sp. AE2032 TaxID=1458463 RepID=UPI00069117E5|nr:class I SAM-dependent methyltransferase [Butyrivibrio sp. AE2032]